MCDMSRHDHHRAKPKHKQAEPVAVAPAARSKSMVDAADLARAEGEGMIADRAPTAPATRRQKISSWIHHWRGRLSNAIRAARTRVTRRDAATSQKADA